MATVAQEFDRAAAQWRDRPFLHIPDETAAAYGIAPGTILYGDAAVAVERLRARYGAAGYGPGERVGVMLENRPAFFLHWLALNGLGASVVPLNPELRPAELDYLVAHSEIALAVGTEAHLPALRQAASRTEHHFAVASDENGVIAAPAGPPARGRGEDGECALLYTSGTTGQPKGCILTNEYFLACGRYYNAVGGLVRLAPGAERLLTPLPMVHMNAMAYSTMGMILAGGCIIPLDRFHPRSWWQSVRESGATIIHYLGIMPSLLLAAEPDPLDRAHRVRFGFGAGVDRRHHAAFEARFGFPLIEGWAMTETGAGAMIIANREPRQVGNHCFGQPEPTLETRLVDEDGREVGADQPGELLVRAAGTRSPRRILRGLSQATMPRPTRPGAAAGSIAATSCGATRPAFSISSIGARTSSGAAARTSRRSRSRPCCAAIPRCARSRSRRRRTSFAARRCWPASCRARRSRPIGAPRPRGRSSRSRSTISPITRCRDGWRFSTSCR